jgi:xanthine dehydrogenase accessory factor
MEREIYEALRRALAEERHVVLATVVSGPRAGRQLLVQPGAGTLGDLGSPVLDALVAARAGEIVARLGCEKSTVTADGEAVDVFIETHGPRPQLVAVGAVHVAIPLVHFARILGFRTVVVDPRSAFATRERFPHADDLIVDWPDEAFARIRFHPGTCVAVLSHDLKIDVPALAHALRHRLAYVGALGSKKTQQKRRAALEAAGVPARDIDRIHAPIGLDLGGRRAEEVALAIMAEIVAVTQGGRAAGAGAASVTEPPGSEP